MAIVLATLAAGSTASGATAPDAAAEEPVQWLSGQQLDAQLALPVGITWNATPLREALQRLARTQRVALLLDRRIDPDQPVDFAADQQPLEAALRQLAAGLGADAVLLGSVVYLAPQAEADRLATAAMLRREEVASLPAAARQRWNRSATWNWPDLATPRNLLAELAEAAGLDSTEPAGANPHGARQGVAAVEGCERIPHDLWPAADLPPMTLADRWSLVLAGFSLTYRVAADGSSVQLLPLPEQLTAEQSYPLPADAETLTRRLQRQLAGARLQRRGNRLTVAGTWRQHREVARALRETAPQAGKGPIEQRYSLRVENKTVGSTARALAARLNRRLETDPGATAALGKLITFEVKDATLDGLLHALFDPAGLRFEVDEERIRVLVR
ncbi:MAG: hypothetical protein J5I93_16290 [Pirellulaceae bacterium]|nr:hypothetical protein [Pirellulaceae bacterium]